MKLGQPLRLCEMRGLPTNLLRLSQPPQFPYRIIYGGEDDKLGCGGITISARLVHLYGYLVHERPYNRNNNRNGPRWRNRNRLKKTFPRGYGIGGLLSGEKLLQFLQRVNASPLDCNIRPRN